MQQTRVGLAALRAQPSASRLQHVDSSGGARRGGPVGTHMWPSGVQVGTFRAEIESDCPDTSRVVGLEQIFVEFL